MISNSEHLLGIEKVVEAESYKHVSIDWFVAKISIVKQPYRYRRCWGTGLSGSGSSCFWEDMLCSAKRFVKGVFLLFHERGEVAWGLTLPSSKWTTCVLRLAIDGAIPKSVRRICLWWRRPAALPEPNEARTFRLYSKSITWPLIPPHSLLSFLFIISIFVYIL